jgi:putative GTP pyrophosphokinase
MLPGQPRSCHWKGRASLSGLFYVADKHFELFYHEKLESRKRAEASIDTDHPSLEQEINLETMTAYLHRKFPDRDHTESPSVSELVEEVTASGYSSLAELDAQINYAWAAFLQAEQDQPPQNAPTFADVGAVRGALALADDAYSMRKYGRLESKKYAHLLPNRERE